MNAIQAEDCKVRTNNAIEKLKHAGWNCEVVVKKAPWSRYTYSPALDTQEGSNPIGLSDTM